MPMSLHKTESSVQVKVEESITLAKMLPIAHTLKRHAEGPPRVAI